MSEVTKPEQLIKGLADLQGIKVAEALDALIETVTLFTEAEGSEAATEFAETLKGNIIQDATRLHMSVRLLTDLKDLA